MKIVIAGAGSVGTHLARLFTKEKHDVTLIDNSEKRLAVVGNFLDIITKQGESTSIEVLEEADIRNADLFVGVTPEESTNMMCCILAHKMGAKKTVARIDNEDYLTPDNREFFKSLGVDSMVYPEGLVGKEINHLIERPWVRHWWEMENGQLIVLGVKIRKGGTLIDKPIQEICGPNEPFHITAIKRAGETIIPHGKDIIRTNDLAFITTTPQYVEYVQNVVGKGGYSKAKNVMYMGASDTALCSINSLPPEVHAKVFESDGKRVEEIEKLIRNKNVMLFNEDARGFDKLEEENIRGHQVFVATTENSETNILACLAAQRMGVQKTIAQVENSDYIPLAESFDVGSIINKRTFAAGQIYRMMLRSDVETVKALNIAAAEVAVYHVKENSQVTQKPVWQLNLPDYANFAGLVSGGRGFLVNGKTTFLPGDTVVVFCIEGYLKKLERFFK